MTPNSWIIKDDVTKDIFISFIYKSNFQTRHGISKLHN
jgi:hypothetical protein